MFETQSMKQYLKLLIVLSASIFSSQLTKAQNIAAGEVLYEWISDSTYRIILKSYFECSGATEPSTMQLCLSNACTTSVSTVSMAKTSAVNLPPSCTAYPTKCTQPSSSIPGYKEVIYSVMLTLPYRCNAWKFSVSNANRALCANLMSSTFYTETTFNNTGSYQGNSSPWFINKPIMYACINNPFTYNSSAIDPNGDSLVTDIVNIRTSTICGGTPSSVAFNTASPSLSVPTNPFQTNNTTVVNATTGQLSCTPAVLGENISALRVREYRSGNLISSVFRDLRFVMLSCSTSSTTTTSPFLALTNCGAGTSGITACIGVPFSFGFDVKSTDTSAILSISDNSSFSTPGAVVTYNVQNTDSVRVTYSWTLSSTMMRNVIFTIKDSTCRPPGIITYNSFSVPISVHFLPKTFPDTFICQGKSIVLSGGNNWSIISGTPGSLSCTTCTNPVATPTTKSVYRISVPACPSLNDTITIDVKPVTIPTLTLSANPGTTISSGTSVTFTANTTNCTNAQYLWRKNGTVISGVTTSTYTTSALANGNIISCELTCNDSCPNPKVQSQQLTMNVTSGIASMQQNGHFTISPNPNNGIFTITNQSATNGKYNLQVVNSLGQEVYKKQDVIFNAKASHYLNLNHLPVGTYTLKINEEPYRIIISK